MKKTIFKPVSKKELGELIWKQNSAALHFANKYNQLYKEYKKLLKRRFNMVRINGPKYILDRLNNKVLNPNRYGTKKIKKVKNSNIQSRIGISSEPHAVYKTNLKKWLSKTLEFKYIDYANFTNKMRLATVEFDKNNTIYVLIPEDVFQPSIKWEGNVGGDPNNPWPITTPGKMIEEIEELEPKNIIDYIFRGSGLSRYLRKHKIIE